MSFGGFSTISSKLIVIKNFWSMIVKVPKCNFIHGTMHNCVDYLVPVIGSNAKKPLHSNIGFSSLKRVRHRKSF